MARRHLRRRIAETSSRVAPSAVDSAWRAERVVTRQAPIVERLAYTRSQAAEALGRAAELAGGDRRECLTVPLNAKRGAMSPGVSGR